MYKRRKINNEDSNNNCMSKLTSLHPNYGKVGSSSKVVDYLNDFALANFLGSLEDGKYGSVTKEYEALHAQRMQVINFLSTLRPSVASRTSQSGISTCSDPSSRQNQINSDGCGDNLSRDIIDLDVVTAADASSPIRILAKQTQVADNNISPHANASGSVMHKKKSDTTIGPLDSSPVTKEDKEHTAVIVLDSDEEDACQVGSRYASHSEHEFSDFRASLTSQIQKHMLQASKLAQEISFNQLVPYDQVNSKSHCGVTFKPNWQPSVIYEKVVLQTVHEKQRFQDVVNENYLEMRAERQDAVAPNTEKNKYPNAEMNMKKEDDVNPKFISSIDVDENSSSMGIFYENEKESSQGDGLEDLWKDMSLAMEYSKSDTSDEQEVVQQEEECNHSYLLRDDYGLVCRICGVIQKSIDTIFDYQWMKVSRATRTYLSGSQNSKDLDETEYSGLKVLEDDFIAAEVSIHPRHLKQMKPHQLEGFNFLVKNLVTDKPGGCILAHAPGSGKTFMLISFIQSFLALYPSKKPLVVLPKGILPVWKQEFQRWQVEDFPIYDFYSSKADNRSQQLEVLKLWQENKSILFLGYKQFSNIIYDKENSKVSAACREILLKIPSLLILDEGHTPRNKDTYILDSLAKVQTPRKVVLSGTLFQNHVREVFTILDLVHPKFLRMESSRAIVKRVLSRVHISGGRKLSKDGVENAFFDLVEETLQNDKNFKRKVTVIQDLRELTKDILHYYKGDFLEELPGLVDFTVLLNLSPKQKLIVQKLAKFEKFKKASVGSAVYIHPHLYDTAEKASGDRVASFKDDKIDSLLETINVKDGVKTKFFLNILSLSESTGEKLLAFSQYILPLKFLERLVVKTKGWHLGKEIFMISGDTNPEERTWSMEQFNKSPDAKVFFGSIKACGEGISLVGASRVVMLDVHLNPSVTRQAIGRAFRPGQLKKVYTYRLVAADSPEEVHHYTSFSKDLISKMWFEWSEYCGHQAFELDEVNMDSCEDLFLESPIIGEDIKGVYRR